MVSRDLISEDTVQCFQANSAFFQAENKKLVDEKKRLGRQPSVLDDFGIQGNFKKLELD